MLEGGRGETFIGVGIIETEEKVDRCGRALVSIRLLKRGKDMCPDIVN